MKRVLAFVLAFVMIFALTACGGGKVDVTGKYTCKAIEGDGMAMDPAALGMTVEIELKDGGKLSMNMGEEPIEGTWELKDDKVILTVDGDSVECSYEDGCIKMDQEGQLMWYVKEGAKLPEDIQKQVDEFDLSELLG